MSREAWGDDGGDDYAHVDTLIETGWWPSEQVEEVKDAIAGLRSETLYEDGEMVRGVSVRFLARITMLEVAAGVRASNDPLAVEAAAMFSKP